MIEKGHCVVPALSAAQHHEPGISRCLDRLTTLGCCHVSHTALGQCCGAGGVAKDGHALIVSSIVLSYAFGNLFLPGFKKVEQ